VEARWVTRPAAREVSSEEDEFVPQNVLFVDRRKFMWDGEARDSRADAEAKKAECEAQGFETQIVEEEGNFLLYTRRVVKEVVVEGEPPPA
jgi:hypothetical protein